ncbi:MAG TPA: hypothetical protein PKK43_15615, partial [Spirochaetota bacterium]|nr:hypothetical protein [Spirochaetota bacterium]
KPKPAEKAEKPKPESVKAVPKNAEARTGTTVEPKTRVDEKSAVPAKAAETTTKQATGTKPAQ